MRLLDYFRSNRSSSASVAKERLQVLVAHERTMRNAPSYLPQLQNEILAVIKKCIHGMYGFSLFNGRTVIVRIERSNRRLEMTVRKQLCPPVSENSPVYPIQVGDVKNQFVKTLAEFFRLCEITSQKIP